MAVPDGIQLQSQRHRRLRPVRERQQHPGPPRGRPHPQQQRKVWGEAVREVGVRGLPAPRVPRWLEGEGLGVQAWLAQWPHPRGQRLPQQLGQC